MQCVLACGAWLCNVCSEHKLTQIFIHLDDFEKLQQVMSIFHHKHHIPKSLRTSSHLEYWAKKKGSVKNWDVGKRKIRSEASHDSTQAGPLVNFVFFFFFFCSLAIFF